MTRYLNKRQDLQETKFQVLNEMKRSNFDLKNTNLGHILGQNSNRWTVGDYFLALVGLIDGALSAFPEGSEMFDCNENTQEFRLRTEAMVEDLRLDAKEDAIAEFADALSYVGQMCRRCQ